MRWATGGAAAKSAGSHGLAISVHRAEHDAAPQAPPDHPVGRRPRCRDVTGSEVLAGDRLRGDRDRVQRERQQRPNPERDLVRRDGRVALPGGDGGRGDEHHLQRERPEHQRRAGLGRGLQPGKIDAQPHARSPCAGRHHHQVGGRADVLGDDCAPGRARDAPVQAEHEGRVQRDVQYVGQDRDDERSPGVLQPAQHSGAGQDGQHGGRREQADPQVGDRASRDGGRGAERVGDRIRERQPDGQDRDADRSGEPEAVDALPDRCLPVARPELPGDGSGRAVGEEDRDVDQGGQRLGGDAEAAEWCGAEPANDGRVREQEQRLGDERDERGDRQPQDLGVRSADPGRTISHSRTLPDPPCN